MLENLNLNEGIESSHEAGEPEIKKGRDRIEEQCHRTRKETKGTNPSVMLENPKQNEGIESRCDPGEPVTK